MNGPLAHPQPEGARSRAHSTAGARYGPPRPLVPVPPLAPDHHRQNSAIHMSRQNSQNPGHDSSPLSPQGSFSPVMPEAHIDMRGLSQDNLLRLSPSHNAFDALQPLVSSTDTQATIRRQPDRRDIARTVNVGEYALHHLLTMFIGAADARIEKCMSEINDNAVDIESVCGAGADQEFDRLIRSLGRVGRDRPKPLIDAVIMWRRKKNGITQELYAEQERLRAQEVSSSRTNVRRLHNDSQYSINSDPLMKSTDLNYEIKRSERRSIVSVYIVCRTLIEIIAQHRNGSLTGETSERLEDVIWMLVRAMDMSSLSQSLMKQALWNIYGQLLGVMSGPSFRSISERYMNELGAMQARLSVKGHMDIETEKKAVYLLANMSWLKIRITPDSAWDQSCDLIKLISYYFANVHGRAVKHAYCQLIEDLLLPIAAKATAQFNSLKWRSVLDTLRPKIAELLIKPKHWIQAFPLLTVTLCTSPSELFNAQWLNTAQNLQPKLRDRSTRSHALKALCRLTWRFLYRIHDRDPLRKVDEILKLVLQPGKRAILSTEPSIADPLIQLIRIIGYRHQEYALKKIIFPLLNAETILGGKETRIEALEPERMVIGIRAYLAIVADLERGEQPRFPQSFDCDALLDTYNRSPHSHRRSTSQSSFVQPEALDLQAKPVNTKTFNDVTKAYHVTFCKILGEICIICDNAFGGQAVLEEKLSQTMPKTPVTDSSFAFSRREEIYSPTDVRQGFYDLLHVAVQALPRCILPDTQFNPLVNLLCTGTAHMQSHIASSSAQALKSIARESGIAQQVASGFSRFIFNFDDKYATVADGGLLGAQHIESTLRLYVELIEIWIEQLQKDTRKASLEGATTDTVVTRSATNDLNRSRQFAHVDEVEAHGLFFLCSPSRHVRAFAIRVLRLVSKFDQALGRPSTRIDSILEGSSQQVIDVNDDSLTTAERSRLQKGLRKSNIGSTLVELCSSDISHDSALWIKVFPGLIRLSQLTCPQAVLLTREIVCSRLGQTQALVGRFADAHHDSSIPGRYGPRHTIVSEVTIEQWKLHLIFACTTLTNVGTTPSIPDTHSRKSSKNAANHVPKITSAAELFNAVVVFLGASNERVRTAAAVGLGTIGPNLYKALLGALQNAVAICGEDDRSRSETPSRNMNSPRRTKRIDLLRTEVTHLYRLTAHCLADEQVASDEWIANNIVVFLSQLRIFLNHHEVVHQLEHQKLRTHFCGLVEVLYDIWGKNRASKYMSFKNRITFFTMMENWCGYAPNQSTLTEREDMMRRSLLEATPDGTHRGGMTAAFEIEKKDLRAAALSAMAALCAGPVLSRDEGPTVIQFDIRRMLQWIDTIFNDTPSDKTHATGRRALKNLIVHNLEHTYLLSKALEMCYFAKAPKTLSSYFDVVTQVLSEVDRYDIPFWKVLCAGLYTLGNEKSDIRVRSIRMLRTLEEKAGKSSKLQDLDISVSDKTTAVYKLAQFQVSQRLAREHGALAFHVFSEFSFYFKDLNPDHQRNMVSAMLPWLQTIELQVDTRNQPTASSYMLLVNLVEITVRSSNALHHEIQALWQALATGPHGGNVQVVLDFIITVCLERGEQNFVDYAKQVVVFLSGTPAGAKVIEFLLLQLTPQSVVHDSTVVHQPPANAAGLAYIADLNHILPMGEKQCAISLGQLAMMLMVDLVVSPVQLARESVPVLLQTIITQWDAYTELVQDQAREMLVHLIHELVISKIDPAEMTVPSKASIEDFIESIRRLDPRVTWTYEDVGRSISDNAVSGVPSPMASVIEEVVRVFSVAFELQSPGYDIRAEWAKTTLLWATSCPVRHIACRSFQIYRCILQHADMEGLELMLGRLSNTIADDKNDYLTFSKEILMTLKTIIERLEPVEILQYPQLFWITAACLDTIYEAEFVEALTMLEQLLDRLDLSDPALIKLFNEKRPDQWQGEFNGLHSLVYKGLKSGKCLHRCLKIMDRMVKLPSNALVGEDDRLLYTTLANIPMLLHHFDSRGSTSEATQAAFTLSTVAEAQGHTELAIALSNFNTGPLITENEFLNKVVAVLKNIFLDSHDFKVLVFLIGLLTNNLTWYKVKTMKLLSMIWPDVNMSKPGFASLGPDFIAPLLRLLQTGLVEDALNVMDYIMNVRSTADDEKLMRMSMTGHASSKATRREFGNVESYYGIPEESGWSIPVPATQSATTRWNVQTVVKSCVNGQDSMVVGTPVIEFHDDRVYSNYFPGGTDAQTSDLTATPGAMNDLVKKLDSLDDFFDDHDDLPSTTMSQYPAISHDERETLYDKHTLPILHKSLDSNGSVTSFHAGFEDQRYPSPRENVMSPTAFASSASLNRDLAIPRTRPGLHNRSTTTPAVPTTRRGLSRNDTFSEDDADNERQDVLSDDDLALSRPTTNEAPMMARQASADAPTFRMGKLRALRSAASNASLGRGLRPSMRRMMSASADIPVPALPTVDGLLLSPVPPVPPGQSNSAPPAIQPQQIPPEESPRLGTGRWDGL